MYLVPLYMDGRKGPDRAYILASATANADVLVDGRHHWREVIVG